MHTVYTFTDSCTIGYYACIWSILLPLSSRDCVHLTINVTMDTGHYGSPSQLWHKHTMYFLHTRLEIARTSLYCNKLPTINLNIMYALMFGSKNLLLTNEHCYNICSCLTPYCHHTLQVINYCTKTDVVIVAKEPFKVNLQLNKTYFWCACGHSKKQVLVVMVTWVKYNNLL